MPTKVEINYEKEFFSNLLFFKKIPDILVTIANYLQLKKIFLIVNVVSQLTMKKISQTHYPFKDNNHVLAFPLLSLAESQTSSFPLGEIYFAYPDDILMEKKNFLHHWDKFLEIFLHSFLHLCGHQHFDVLASNFMAETVNELKQLLTKKLIFLKVDQQKLTTLHVITGPMFAGKTAVLIDKITNLQKAGKKVLVFKPKQSCRFSAYFVVAHNGKNIRSHCLSNDKLEKIFSMIENDGNKYDLIAFDEVHFFSLNFFKIVQKLLATNHHVLVSGLNKGFSEHNLPIMNKLLKTANQISFLKGKCFSCSQPSTKTQAVDYQGHPLPPRKIKNYAGGKEKYQTRCDHCYVAFSW